MYVNLRKQPVETFPRKTGGQTLPAESKSGVVDTTALGPSFAFPFPQSKYVCILDGSRCADFKHNVAVIGAE